MPAKSKADIVRRVRALMARAADPGATEEEQRTSAHIAAKLCREHGIDVGELGGDAQAPAAAQSQHARIEIMINGVRTVVETVNAGLGFDVFAFAQGLIRERMQEELKRAAAPRAVRVRSRKRK